MLFETQQAYADPEYEAFLEQAELSHTRLWLESLWAAFSPYADADFLTQARIDFHARFWEMFVANVFLESGFTLLPNLPGAPDIGVVLSDGRKLWVEAVTPGSGTGPDAVEPMSDEGGWIPAEQIVLRLQNAVTCKLAKIRTYQQTGTVAETEPVLVAVNARKIRYTLLDSDPSFALQCVFPIGDPYASLDRQTHRITGQGYSQRPSIVKKSGAAVATTLFIDPGSAPLSGVLYSQVSPFQLSLPEHRLSEACRVVHNPMAAVACPKEVPAWGGEAWATRRDGSWHVTWTW